jgi:O-antigen/teichoic acid export membrane protein
VSQSIPEQLNSGISKTAINLKWLQHTVKGKLISSFYMFVRTLLNKYISEIPNIAKKGFFYLFATNGLILVIGFVSQLFVAGILDPVDIGRIKIMQTYIGLASLLGGFGFNTSLLKLASEKRSEEEKADLLHLSMLVATVSFLLLYLVLFYLSKSSLISNDPKIARLFPYYALFLLPLNIQSMQLAYYQATKEIRMMAVIQFYVKLISVGLIIVVTYFYKLEGYISIISITGFISVFSLRKGLFGFGKKLMNLKFNFTYLIIMWKLAKYVLLANLGGTLLGSMDIYLINYLVEDRVEIGYYMFALTIVSTYQIIPVTIQQVAFPFFSSKSENHINWLNSYKKYNKLNHIILIPLCLSGIIIIPPFIKFVFSGKYDASIIYFVFFSLAWMLNSLNMMKGTALMGYGKFNLNFYTLLISLTISFPVMYFLIRQHDLNGAIIGKIFAGAVNYAATFLLFRSFVKNQT